MCAGSGERPGARGVLSVPNPARQPRSWLREQMGTVLPPSPVSAFLHSPIRGNTCASYFFFLKKNTQKNPSNILLVGLRNTRAQLPVTGGRRLLAPQLKLWVPRTTSRPRSCPSVCVPRLGGGSAAEIGLHQPAPPSHRDELAVSGH